MCQEVSTDIIYSKSFSLDLGKMSFCMLTTSKLPRQNGDHHPFHNTLNLSPDYVKLLPI